MKKFLVVFTVMFAIGCSQTVWANSSCNSTRDCACIAEATPVCKKMSNQEIGICACVPKKLQ